MARTRRNREGTELATEIISESGKAAAKRTATQIAAETAVRAVGTTTGGKVAAKFVPFVGAALMAYEGSRSAARDVAHQWRGSVADLREIKAALKRGDKKEAAAIAARGLPRNLRHAALLGPRTGIAAVTTADVAEKIVTRSNGKLTGVQSLLFARSMFSSTQARDWARSHGYKASSIDVTGNNIRIRQFPPSRGSKGRFRTIKFKPGVLAVVVVKGKGEAMKRTNPKVSEGDKRVLLAYLWSAGSHGGATVEWLKMTGWSETKIKAVLGALKRDGRARRDGSRWHGVFAKSNPAHRRTNHHLRVGEWCVVKGTEGAVAPRHPQVGQVMATKSPDWYRVHFIGREQPSKWIDGRKLAKVTPREAAMLLHSKTSMWGTSYKGSRRHSPEEDAINKFRLAHVRANPKRDWKPASGRLVARVGEVKIYKDTDWGEFVVVPPGAKSDKRAAFTDSKEDALGIAADMHARFGRK